MEEKQDRLERVISYLLCGAEVVLCCFGFLLSQVIVTVVLMVPYVFAKITLFLAKGLDSIEAGTELARLLNEDFIPNNTPWISILSAALAVGVMLLIMRKLHPPFTDWLRMKKAPLSSFVPVAPLAVGLQILISLVLGLVMMLPAMEPFAQEMADYSSMIAGSSNKLVELLAVAVAAPLSEEIFFRGAILSSFKKTKMPLWLSVTLQAALFGLIHGLPLQMAYAFLLGLLLGALTEKCQSLWPSVLLHALFNAAGYWTELLSDSTPGWVMLLLLLLSAVITLFSLRTIFHPQKGVDNAT